MRELEELDEKFGNDAMIGLYGFCADGGDKLSRRNVAGLGIDTVCDRCGKIFLRHDGHVLKLEIDNLTKFYCSPSCHRKVVLAIEEEKKRKRAESEERRRIKRNAASVERKKRRKELEKQSAGT